MNDVNVKESYKVIRYYEIYIWNLDKNWENVNVIIEIIRDKKLE